MNTEEIKKSGNEKMEKCIAQLKKELSTIRTGRANPLILEKVLIDYYGTPTKLRQLSQVTVQDGTTLVITPFDKTIVKEVEKALIKADLGITPSSDGVVVRLVFPPLTADRRKELSKEVKATGETAKVAIRNVRRDLTDEIQKAEKAVALRYVPGGAAGGGGSRGTDGLEGMVYPGDRRPACHWLRHGVGIHPDL